MRQRPPRSWPAETVEYVRRNAPHLNAGYVPAEMLRVHDVIEVNDDRLAIFRLRRRRRTVRVLTSDGLRRTFLKGALVRQVLLGKGDPRHW